ncbi:MAG TPA: HD domain-containing protein [Rhizomicrobium sp.]|nr:HD domain-containing protein [Rhizomicrobium sp.]
MTDPKNLEEIEQLYALRGCLHYGEGVTQIEHALQSAILAEAEGAGPDLIVAALLHDIGHLLVSEEDVAQGRFDDRHEAVGARMLKALFPEPVWRPVALHVAAKRYLCFTEPQYWAGLSPASRQSLKLQGGPFDQAQALVFQSAPFWQEAVRLRRFDDMGKRAEISGRAFADYLPMMRDLSAAVTKA